MANAGAGVRPTIWPSEQLGLQCKEILVRVDDVVDRMLTLSAGSAEKPTSRTTRL
jgi:hypothetical protein